MNFKNIQGQLARWLEELAQYNMVIQHRSGKKHQNADALSRIPDTLPLCHEYKSNVPLTSLPCGGCPFCTRAKQQWSTFEDDIDYVVPIAIRSANISDTDTIGNSLGFQEFFNTEDLAIRQDQDKDINKIKSWLRSEIVPSQKELALSSSSVKYLVMQISITSQK